MVWLKFDEFNEFAYLSSSKAQSFLILADIILGKFDKLYATKLIGMQCRQILAASNFHHLIANRQMSSYTFMCIVTQLRSRVNTAQKLIHLIKILAKGIFKDLISMYNLN